MSLDLSRSRMEGVSGLAMISPHQRNFLSKIMNPPEPSLSSALTSTTLGLHNFMHANVGLGSVGGVTAFNAPYSLAMRPSHNRLPSPKSPTNRGLDGAENESRGEHTKC